MFDELVGQVKKLFSSRSNGGRLVYNLCDRLHYYKQVLLATSIILLLGYSQFRDHFECRPVGLLDKKTLTNYCWINGTATLDLRQPDLAGQTASRQRRPARTQALSAGQQPYSKKQQQQQMVQSQQQLQLQQAGLLEGIASLGGNLIPHVGIHFRARDDRYELVSHNYMRSLWALLILIGACSFLAQRKWANLFATSDLLRALLQLPGHQELAQSKRAQEADAYRTLMRLTSQADSGGSQKLSIQLAELGRLRADAELAKSLELLASETNEHDRSLDYYPNQLIYLLVARSPEAQRLADLGLRGKLLRCSLWSCTLTGLQFALPWLFIGDKYPAYGPSYARAWLAYFQTLVGRPGAGAAPSNSLDYQISSRIWPTMVFCQYKQFGAHGVDSISTICLVPINEICGKLFAVIWWFVAINLAIELLQLASLLLSSLNKRTIEWSLGRRCWPAARAEVREIASFRHRQARLLEGAAAAEHEKEEEKELLQETGKSARQKLRSKRGLSSKESALPTARELDAHERKRIEAGADSSAQSFRAKKWYLWCTRDIGLFLADKGKRIRQGQRVAAGEPAEDINVYYLLALLYLRLGCSQRKTEQVARMTHWALDQYLDSIRHLKGGKLNPLRSGQALQPNQLQPQAPHRTVKPQELAQAASKTQDTIIDVML